MLLLPSIKHPGRIVTVVSETYRGSAIDLQDVINPAAYDRFSAYANSKAAALHFSLLLNDKLRACGRRIDSFAANPGVRLLHCLSHPLVVLDDEHWAEHGRLYAVGSWPRWTTLPQDRLPSGLHGCLLCH